ncbi:MAG: trypsin-like serine protease [Pirellulales bacterium]|nr:trypsin-like serine protease [Pirellulales bacterium]
MGRRALGGHGGSLSRFARSGGVVLALWGGALLLAAAPVQAGTIRDDLADSQYTSLAGLAAFASVGEFQWTASGSNYLASGTLIDEQWVLTAAHVVEDIDSSNIGTMTFTLGSATYRVVETYYSSDWTGNTSDGGDIGLVKLATAIADVVPASLYEQTDERYQIATVVGYGSTGTGLTGAVLSAGTKRAGTNVIGLGSALAGIPWSGGGDDTMLVADFDQPGETGDPTTDLAVATDLEYCGAPGDSGGGWFIEEDGQYFLAGVTSFLVHNPANPENAMYGDIFGATRVSSYLDWIFQYVDLSEPPPGDADGDGDVDEEDAAAVAAHWLCSGGWAEGDFNGDGVVDDLDLAILAANWSEGEPPGSVPEPATPALLAALFAAALARRWTTPHPTEGRP